MWRRMAALAVVLSACGTGEEAPHLSATHTSGPADVGGAAEPAVHGLAMEQAIVQPVSLPRGGVAADASAARMIVRTADVTMQVADVRRVVQQVTDLTAASKGFLGTSRLWRDGDADHASMTIRVPAEALNQTLAKLRALAVRVENEAVTGEDVTRQAVDLSAQLTNLRATETELRALLVTVRQRTQKASEVLEVHTELARVRGEIEQKTAELQTLTQLSALSTISLALHPDVVATPIASDTWQPVAVLREATRALVGAVRTGVNAVIWAVVCGVPLAIVAVLAVGLARTLRRRLRPVSPA
jgi:Domain of unknown function (DUF4349)